MGIASSRKKKVAPVLVTEENVYSTGSDRNGRQLFGPSNTETSDPIVSVRKRADCNSEGQESEFSAEDGTLADGVDRILAECENTDARLDVTPPKDLLSSANTENTTTPSGFGICRGPSLALPVMYDASEEELMNTIEQEFG